MLVEPTEGGVKCSPPASYVVNAAFPSSLPVSLASTQSKPEGASLRGARFRARLFCFRPYALDTHKPKISPPHTPHATTIPSPNGASLASTVTEDSESADR